MKKSILLTVLALAIAGVTFAGGEKKEAKKECTAKKECCKKEAGKSCCAKKAETSEVKKEEMKAPTK